MTSLCGAWLRPPVPIARTPAASYYKILRTPADALETTTQLFLAIRFNCNKCHDHPFERWTQDQYYQTAAYFAQVASGT